MTQRRFHYELAFEHYLRSNRIPYIAVDEARKALLPRDDAVAMESIKSFDFLVHARHDRLIVDIKGRRYGSTQVRRGDGRGGQRPGGRRFQTWVTLEDVRAMRHWEQLFGSGYRSVFVFLYALQAQPPDALFETVFAHGSHWYAMRSIDVQAYESAMHARSTRWRTVDLPREDAEALSVPFRLSLE